MTTIIKPVVPRAKFRKIPGRDSTINASMREVINDLGELQSIWNNRLYPLLDKLPRSANDPVDVFTGLGGNTIWSDWAAVSTTGSLFWSTSNSRKMTIKESLIYLDTKVDTIYADLSTLINTTPAAATDLTAVNTAIALNTTRIEQVARDLLGTNYWPLTNYSTGTQSVTHSIGKLLKALLDLHGGAAYLNDYAFTGAAVSLSADASIAGVSSLDEAYDGGGAGLGRAITADSGPVLITSSVNTLLNLNYTRTSGSALELRLNAANTTTDLEGLRVFTGTPLAVANGDVARAIHIDLGNINSAGTGIPLGIEVDIAAPTAGVGEEALAVGLGIRLTDDVVITFGDDDDGYLGNISSEFTLSTMGSPTGATLPVIIATGAITGGTTPGNTGNILIDVGHTAGLGNSGSIGIGNRLSGPGQAVGITLGHSTCAITLLGNSLITRTPVDDSANHIFAMHNLGSGDNPVGFFTGAGTATTTPANDDAGLYCDTATGYWQWYDPVKDVWQTFMEISHETLYPSAMGAGAEIALEAAADTYKGDGAPAGPWAQQTRNFIAPTGEDIPLYCWASVPVLEDGSVPSRVRIIGYYVSDTTGVPAAATTMTCDIMEYINNADSLVTDADDIDPATVGTSIDSEVVSGFTLDEFHVVDHGIFTLTTPKLGQLNFIIKRLNAGNTYTGDLHLTSIGLTWYGPNL